jgi:hypothetical protein
MKKRFWASILIATVWLLSLASPVLAAPADPDSITTWQPKVFENIWETGDMLFVLEYDIEYASEPDEPASDTFLVKLIDTDGTTLLLSRSLLYYQHNLISIYATAAQVTALGITWEGAHKIVLTANPALFGTITEGTNKVTRTLAASDYNADGTLTSKELLRDHCIDIAEALESDWGVTLISTTATGTQVLNSAGTTVFLDAIPELDDALVDLFILSSQVITADTTIATADYAVDSRIDARLGTDLSNSLSGIGTFLGIGDNSSAGLWAIITIITIASIVFLSTGNSTAALILVVPVVVMMTYLGAIPEAITYVLAIFVVIYSMYFFWLRGT